MLLLGRSPGRVAKLQNVPSERLRTSIYPALPIPQRWPDLDQLDVDLVDALHKAIEPVVGYR
jgi:hypothetical protein